MSAVRNKVQLIGTVTGVPAITKLDDGRSRGLLTLTTKESYRKHSGEKVDEEITHHVLVIGKLAAIAEKYVTDSVEIAIEGKLITRPVKDTNNNMVLVCEVHASELLILSKR